MEFKQESRNLFFNQDVNQDSIGNLTKKIIKFNDTDGRIEK